MRPWMRPKAANDLFYPLLIPLVIVCASAARHAAASLCRSWHHILASWWHTPELHTYYCYYYYTLNASLGTVPRCGFRHIPRYGSPCSHAPPYVPHIYHLGSDISRLKTNAFCPGIVQTMTKLISRVPNLPTLTWLSSRT